MKTPEAPIKSGVITKLDFKTGKTRLWKELMELMYPNDPDAGLLIAWEDGYTTWKLKSIIPMHKFNWEMFKTKIVPNLVKEAKEGKQKSKVLGMDTIDRMMQAAEQYIINKFSKKYGTKFETLQEITETVKEVNGHIELKNEVWGEIDKLKTAGYGMIYLAWTKEKETTTIDDLKFHSVELSLSKTGRDIFASQAHLICTLFNEVKVLDKTGNELKENITNKKGKEVASNFHATETFMYFRPSSYIAIAGGRFTHLPDKIPYSAEGFMKVFEEAVKHQLGDDVTDMEVEALRVEQEQEKAEEVKENLEREEKKEEQQTAGELQAKIKEATKGLKKEQLAVAVPKFKEIFGGHTADYTKIDDAELLNQALKFVEGLLK